MSEKGTVRGSHICLKGTRNTAESAFRIFCLVAEIRTKFFLELRHVLPLFIILGLPKYLSAPLRGLSYIMKR
jgi:hypothetical protein